MRYLLNSRGALLVLINVLFGCVLCFYQSGQAAPKEAAEPFANPTEQRAETVKLLKEISAQLKEQNALLASGKLQVVIQNEAGAHADSEAAPAQPSAFGPTEPAEPEQPGEPAEPAPE